MSRSLRRRHGSILLLCSAGLAFTSTGCLDRPIDTLEPKLTRGVVENLKSSRVEKIDLLLAIDNSISMFDKQKLLGDAVPQLVNRLVNPRCVDTSKTDPVSPQEIPQPEGPLEPCPNIDKGGESVPTKREFKPVKDIHVGIISSSLGDLGSGICAPSSFVKYPDDKGHLLDRVEDGTATTFEGKHFLLWDPDGNYGPSTEVASFQQTLKEMVLGVGQTGCGYEMQLESVYRFLVDPNPYDKLVKEPVQDLADKMVKQGQDDELLKQRRDFLRPDSLVAVIMLSDENDCSIQAEGYGYFALNAELRRGATICETDPNDPCCYSCNGKPPEGCDPDPICEDENAEAEYESIGLRCWDQKRRYGADLLYPVERYKNALTLETIAPSRNDLLPRDGDETIANPLLVDRPPNLVYFAGIVGVPWQAIARKNADGDPDLSLGYMGTNELASAGLFRALAGDPDGHVPPKDPFMIESADPRTGTSDLLNASPSESNAINGGDRTPATDPQDYGLQYTCIFDVTDVPNGTDCDDCGDGCDNPVCNGTTQTHAKAAPGLRQLSLIEKMDERGIAASVCPAQTDDTNGLDYGYDPAVGAIVDALKDDLGGQQCLPFSIKPEGGLVSCLVVQSSRSGDCENPGLAPVPDDKQNVLELIKSSTGYDPNEPIFCLVEQLGGEPLATCQNEENVPAGIDGWCYIDASDDPDVQVGNPDLVQCDPTEPRILRVVGDPQPEAGQTIHIFCAGEG
ncbi:MAG: hypothetical protein HOW73_33055 [Polyangiaceae bacterium]|nr:hypothetical protein [Polyangiaceae bacterium]